jgi:hypothetical protein
MPNAHRAKLGYAAFNERYLLPMPTLRLCFCRYDSDCYT